MTWHLRDYSGTMYAEFYRLNAETSGEMNIKNDELTRRVVEFVSYEADVLSPFVTAWADDHMVGYAIAKREDHGRKASSAHVAQLRVTVASDYQNRGIGTALVTNVIDKAKIDGVIKRIEVLNYESSVEDRRWFHNLGFEVEGKMKNRICLNGELIDAYMMALVL